MKPTNTATKSQVDAAFKKLDLKKEFKGLVAYANFLQKDSNLNFDAEEIVQEVVFKVLNQERKWDKSNAFKPFLYSVVKSHLDNSRKKEKYHKPIDERCFTIPSSTLSPSEKIDFEITEKQALVALAKLKPHPDESFIFECWLEGTNKPKEISELMEKPVPEVNKIIKRLTRKRQKIQEQLKVYLK